MKLIERLFCTGKIKQLEDQINHLQLKLVERQEVINKTNAYWKKKVSELQRAKKVR